MSKEEVRAALIEELGSWTSGERLAESLEISRAAVWKHVQSLRAEGYEIEASKRGYRLAALPDLICEDLVKSGLRTEFVGRTIHHHPALSSTNIEAKRISSSAKNGTVVVAEVQTLGRGRMERSWQSPKGGVWMSVILKPEIPPALAPRLNMAVAVAVARALKGLYDLEAKIKWPNDILVGEGKVCGILTEIGAEMDSLEYAVVGIGINANIDPALFPEEWKATSLSGLLGKEVSRQELVRRVLEEVEAASHDVDSSFDGAFEEWRKLSATLGRRVRIITKSGEFEGMAECLEVDGSLLVRKDDGRKERVFAGDCVHLRPATVMLE